MIIEYLDALGHIYSRSTFERCTLAGGGVLAAFSPGALPGLRGRFQSACAHETALNATGASGTSIPH